MDGSDPFQDPPEWGARKIMTDPIYNPPLLNQLSEEQVVETPWTDDQIRWNDEPAATHGTDPGSTTKHDGLERKSDDGNVDDDEENGPFCDPFKDPDHLITFSHTFQRPNQSPIVIELQGYRYESDKIWQSTGLTIWKAAHFLCEYMVEHSDEIRNKSVLELGAGLGLCGILAHQLEAEMVYLTDGDTAALHQLRANIASNCPHASQGDGAVVICHQLLWGHERAIQFRTLQKRSFAVIVASDILYSPVIIEPLWETIAALLQPGGAFWLAFAKRRVPVSIEEVLSAADRAGFRGECIQERTDEGLFLYIFHWRENPT